MKNMLLIYSDENTWTESDLEHCYAESIQLAQQLQAQGQYLSAAPCTLFRRRPAFAFVMENGLFLTVRSRKRVNNSAAIS